MKTSTLSPFEGFYISHVSRLQNTKAVSLVALAATLILPADTNYQLTVTTRHLFYPKYGLGVSEFIQLRQTSNQGTSNSQSSTMPCMAYYPMTLGKRCLFDEGLLDFTMMQW